MFTVDGVPNDPTGAKVRALAFDSPLGRLVVETYPSKIGPCYDLVYPGGRREAGCAVGAGVEPDKPVTGDPGTGSTEGVNGMGWNAGMTTPGIGMGMLHWGLVHPAVTAVTIEPEGPGSALWFPTRKAPNVEGLAVFVAWTPEGLERYVVAGYNADGCLLDAELYDIRGRAGFDDSRVGLDCSVRKPDARWGPSPRRCGHPPVGDPSPSNTAHGPGVASRG